VKLDVDAVTFDHFKTLVHPARGTEEDIVFPILRALRRRMPIDEREFLKKYIQRDMEYRKELDETCCECLLDDIVLSSLSDLGFDDEAVRNQVYTAVDSGLATKGVLLYPDALETLEALRERGYLLGLISNTHWRWNENRRRLMDAHFDVITLSYEHGYAKPHPSIFHTTLDQLGVNEGRCLHIGDDPIADIQGAQGAGMKTAFISRDGAEADSDIQVEQLKDLLPYL
jgi:HAD superfamily hydrolase (TIGR01509 family)